MRLLRFLCLLAAIAVVYFAQYIFDYGSLTEFFPEWFLAHFSFASRLMRWQPEDLRVLAWGGSDHPCLAKRAGAELCYTHYP